MEGKQRDILKNIVVLPASIVIGYLFYWLISMRFIDRLYNIDSDFKGFLLYFSHVLCVYVFLKILFKMDIDVFEKSIMSLTYYSLMLLMFFDRVHVGVRVWNMNPFDMINTIQDTGMISITLNVLSFVPFYSSVKWLCKELETKTIGIIFLFISMGIEVLQYLTMRGIFDVGDIFLYTIGYLIGIKIYTFLF